MGEFLLGMLLGLAALAALALVFRTATRRHWQRRQTAAVMDALKDLKREDVERLLKQVCSCFALPLSHHLVLSR